MKAIIVTQVEGNKAVVTIETTSGEALQSLCEMIENAPKVEHFQLAVVSR